MDAEKLDRRITIQVEGTPTRQPNGERVATWNNLTTVWAQKIEANGQERFNADQFLGKTARSFRFRWSETTKQVTTKHRIMFDGVLHDIVAMREIGFRDGIEVDCVARSESPLDA